MEDVKYVNVVNEINLYYYYYITWVFHLLQHNLPLRLFGASSSKRNRGYRVDYYCPLPSDSYSRLAFNQPTKGSKASPHSVLNLHGIYPLTSSWHVCIPGSPQKNIAVAVVKGSWSFIPAVIQIKNFLTSLMLPNVIIFWCNERKSSWIWCFSALDCVSISWLISIRSSIK